MLLRRHLKLFVSVPLISLLGSAGAAAAESELSSLHQPVDGLIRLAAAIPPPEPEMLGSPAPSLLEDQTVPEATDTDRADVAWEPSPQTVAGSSPWAVTSPNFLPFPVEANGAVERFVELFQTGWRRDMVGRWLDRSTRYQGMIRQVFERKGLPQDLAFTAMIESGFNPLAVSRAGAKGLWQFMEQTARRYGLRVDRWVDERLDPVKSTEAAADYLKDLFAQFGHWFLALAAYNAGEVRVARAVEGTRSNNFWTIARSPWLREETKQFVPQIQAAALIAREPERYGFQVTPQETVLHEVVRMPSSVDLRKLAVLAGLGPETLRDLNPELRRGITPPIGGYALRVPLGTAGLVKGSLTKLSAPRGKAAKRPSVVARRGLGPSPAEAGIHVVKPHDTLTGIAKRYGVSVRELLSLNSLTEDDRLYPGDRIRLMGLGSHSGPTQTR